MKLLILMEDKSLMEHHFNLRVIFVKPKFLSDTDKPNSISRSAESIG